jgi:hypothetical protein
VCFISVETVPKVAAKAAKFLGKTFGTFLLSTRLKHTQIFFTGAQASFVALAPVEFESQRLLVELQLVVEIRHGERDRTHPCFGVDGKFGFGFSQ